MLSKIHSAGLIGTDGFLVCVEADVGDGLPGVNLIGYLAPEVREAQDRVKTAIKNSGYSMSPKKITINLSPGDKRKEGCAYDLPIAVAMLKSYKLVKEGIADESLFVGELSLSGQVLGVRGTLSIASAARDAGIKRIFVPKCCEGEGGAIEGIDCYGISSLKEVVDICNGTLPLPKKAEYRDTYEDYDEEEDFSDICGQELIKRATVLSVAGRHNILYIGPAGTGKSMIASRIPGIMPRMSKEERLEVSKLYSVCGLLPEGEPLLMHRPFRSPHHTISSQALTGGGSHPRPGEISLATGGVLFLDELAEFKNSTIEVLRQPMEDKKIVVSRVYGSIEYPTDFVLCAATNPCRCGYYPDRKRCHCTELQVKNYLGKISKPILDRIDICVETGSIGYDELKGKGSGEKSADIRKRIEAVRKIQTHRLKDYGIRFNAEMNNKLIEKFCKLTPADEQFLKTVYEKKGMSARGLHKILKVARTIADLDESSDINHDHLCEAIGYRSLEDKYWGGGMCADV